MTDYKGFRLKKDGERDHRDHRNVIRALQLLRARVELDDSTITLCFAIGDGPLNVRTQSEFLGVIRIKIAEAFGFCPSKSLLKDVLGVLRLLPARRRRRR